MATKCPQCDTYIEFLTFYPHLREHFFKSGIELADIPLEILEEMPKSHLHSYYECSKCKHKTAFAESPLLSDEEVDKLIKDGSLIRPERTISYWQKWLKSKKNK